MEQEWWGYSLSARDKDPGLVEEKFFENIRYAEFWCRSLGLKGSLANRLNALFEDLPLGCEQAITDDRKSLISEFVSVRNRHAHGDYLTQRVALSRLRVLVTKLGAVLLISDVLHEDGAVAAQKLAAGRSPFVRNVLRESDRIGLSGSGPASPVARPSESWSPRNRT